MSSIRPNLFPFIINFILPVLLYTLMTDIDKYLNLDSFIGPTHAAAQAAKYFLYLTIGVILPNLFAPLISSLTKKSSTIGIILYQILFYPAEFFLINIFYLSLLSNNLDTTVRTDLFKISLFTIASFLGLVISRFVNKPADFRGEIIQRSIIRDISLLFTIIIAFIIFIKRP